MPKSFFDARLIARLRALVAARDARLDGDEEREGAWGCGGGGKMALLGGAGDASVGEPRGR